MDTLLIFSCIYEQYYRKQLEGQNCAQFLIITYKRDLKRSFNTIYQRLFYYLIPQNQDTLFLILTYVGMFYDKKRPYNVRTSS